MRPTIHRGHLHVGRPERRHLIRFSRGRQHFVKVYGRHRTNAGTIVGPDFDEK